MPAYLIQHPAEQRREDILIEDPALTLSLEAGWAVFRDSEGICFAIPSGQGAHIQRVEAEQDEQPAPQKE
ncbi:hypothetical protein ACFUJR_14795 [Streptomyces sp. NPDC057271]|uniref:hypothetical protein n=1 Tax=unclassified Streptomyces TaxID=2593676 RepID=UPI003641E23C